MQYILYVTTASIQIYTSETKIAQFPFPEKTILYQEIINQIKFIEALRNFLNVSKLPKGHASMVLADGLVFIDQANTSDKDALQKKTETFFAYIPVNPTNRAQIIISEKDKTYLIAANRTFFTCIQNVFEEFGWKIETIVPGSLLGITDTNMGSIIGAFHHQPLLHKLNLLTKDKLLLGKSNNTVEQNTPSSHAPINKKQYIMLGVSVLFLILAVSFAFMQSASPHTDQTPTQSNPKPQVTAQTPINKAPTTIPVTYKEKGALTVQILNGSTTPGQASKLKTLLTTDGFQQIETGNTQSANIEPTTITIQSTVSPQDTKTLETLLKTIVNEVHTNVASQASLFDVMIVINN